MKSFFALTILSLFVASITFAEQLNQTNQKCQVGPGLGFSMEINDVDFH